MQCTEVRFATLLFGGFTTMAVINPPEKKLTNRISVQCGGTICSRTFNDMVSYGLPTNEAISILLALQTWKPLRYESEFAKGSKYVLMPLSHAFIPFTSAVEHFQAPVHLKLSQNNFLKIYFRNYNLDGSLVLIFSCIWY